MLDETRRPRRRRVRSASDAQARVDEKVAALKEADDLDARRIDMEFRNLLEVENKRADGFEAGGIDEAEGRRRSTRQGKTTRSSGVEHDQERIFRLAGGFLGAAPALIIGLYIWTRRMAAQGEGVVNSEAKKTGSSAASPVRAVALSFWTAPRPREDKAFAPQGAEFYPGFKGPPEGRRPWRSSTRRTHGIRAALQGPGRRRPVVDPLAQQLSADGKERLAKTAASVID